MAMDTATQLLLAAETLIASRGPEAVSLREIARQAGQRNTAALQYHFGSREGLLQHWVHWRMRPVNRLRDRHFGMPGGQETLPGLLHRLCSPFCMQLAQVLAQDGHSHWLRCLARLDLAGQLSAPGTPADNRWQNTLPATLDALRSRLPASSAAWRMDLALSTLLRGLAHIEQATSDGDWPREALEPRGLELEACLAGLLAAPSPATENRP